ncbi:hypothetical protein [Spiroplasma endosymbiont of Notiophilus biguttatus]|uniref:hypothetical protein n=1 Tax=Spiroplasma endosymbiont of Notiophilus biguttatus TaxID=3066285 RepID=UPI00313EC810
MPFHNVKLFHAKNKSIKSEDLMKIVKENVDINNSILFTDEYRGYYKMNKISEFYVYWQ